MSKKPCRVIGKFYRRMDGQARVEGREVYVSDFTLPNMLFGKGVRSPYAHARVKRIDTSRAEAMGAVCLTPWEIPQAKYNERSGCSPKVCYKDRSVLTDTPRHVGEAVAAVAAESEWLALKALDLIEIEYDELPAVLDPIKAMEPGCTQIWDKIQLGDEELKIENNIRFPDSFHEPRRRHS